jgi:flagellar biogenesis protein FliO
MELTEQIAMVLAVFALLGALVWFTKRRGLASFAPRRGKIRNLELLERVQLTPHHAIHMVRVSDKVVLIATAPSTCMLLDAPVSSELRFSVQRDLLSTDK